MDKRKGMEMKSWVAGLVGLGILLLFIGEIYGVYADTTKEKNAAEALDHVGVFLAGLGFALGGILDTDEDKFVRFGLILAAAIFMGLLWHIGSYI